MIIIIIIMTVLSRNETLVDNGRDRHGTENKRPRREPRRVRSTLRQVPPACGLGSRITTPRGSGDFRLRFKTMMTRDGWASATAASRSVAQDRRRASRVKLQTKHLCINLPNVNTADQCYE